MFHCFWPPLLQVTTVVADAEAEAGRACGALRAPASSDVAAPVFAGCCSLGAGALEGRGAGREGVPVEGRVLRLGENQVFL